MRFPAIILILQLLLACDTTPAPVTIKEKLFATLECDFQNESSCSNWRKFLIPTNLDLEGRPIRKLELDTLLLQVKYDSILSYFQFRTMLLSFRSEKPDETYLFTSKVDPIVMEAALFSHEPVSIALTEEQHEIIRTLLENERSVLIYTAVGAYGQASGVSITLFADVMIHY